MTNKGLTTDEWSGMKKSVEKSIDMWMEDERI